MPSRALAPRILVAVLACRAIALAQDRVVHERKSAFNHIVVTDDSRGLRTLRFERGGPRQSVVKVGDPDYLALPYARAMPVGVAFVKEPRRMLIVGLGGGTIPGFLHKHYPETQIDVVDIDPDVVDVARKFFGFRDDATMQAHVDDGRQFIKRCQEPYDIIFLDAFDRDSIPYHLATREFLREVRRALSPGGVVVANIWSRYSNSLYDSMLRTYQEVFPELCIVEVQGAGNEVILALPRRRGVDRDTLVERSRRVSQERQFGFDMGEVVRSGFRHASEEDFSGQILTDRDGRKKAG